MSGSDSLSHRWPALIERIRARTPARVLVDRAGAGYRTETQLELRQAHAAARDAVRSELDLERDLGAEFVARWGIFEAHSQARTKDEYLLRPDLGRKLSEDSARTVVARCPQDIDLQIVIGDGLSVTAVAAQVPGLLPRMVENAKKHAWKLGQPFAIRYCRVGVMNQVGELLRPRVVALLIGERPGLATAESLSAYLAFQPRPGHSDAQRNLISNIHARGVSLELAAARIVNLAGQMIRSGSSGSTLKERLAEPAGRAERPPKP
ncbi:MAG TPA: ethanolamine ammonia-lyase subunit EutC [Candidatus Angelobacter sp.]|nr:ethanolamine ammonia-lyase subunit EutC [Candidatus Angelobacter sp.]